MNPLEFHFLMDWSAIKMFMEKSQNFFFLFRSYHFEWIHATNSKYLEIEWECLWMQATWFPFGFQVLSLHGIVWPLVILSTSCIYAEMRACASRTSHRSMERIIDISVRFGKHTLSRQLNWSILFILSHFFVCVAVFILDCFNLCHFELHFNLIGNVYFNKKKMNMADIILKQFSAVCYS